MRGFSLEALLISVPAILIAVTVHEFAHALIADRLGDSTARTLGRLSLNPIVHLDLLGTVLFVVAGFGWAKPVPVNPRNFTNWRQGMMLVAAAGPLANITLMFILGLVFQLGLIERRTVPGLIVLTTIHINAILAIFNLLPIPPLDGSKILAGLLPPAQAIAYDRLAAYGPVLLLLLLVLAPGLISGLVLPPVNWLVTQAIGAGSP
ncbi:MAG: site-2 protease family protein [Armatimonadota bacterium]